MKQSFTNSFTPTFKFKELKDNYCEPMQLHENLVVGQFLTSFGLSVLTMLKKAAVQEF